MPIEEAEAEKIIVHIEKVIREFSTDPDKQGILDILNQWRSDVEAGRPVEQKIRVRQSPGLDVLAGTPQTRATKSGDFVGKKDYSKIEQLDMLITALGLAFIAPQMMARYFLDTINKNIDSEDGKLEENAKIHLISIGDTAERELISPITFEKISQSQNATQRLTRLLVEISREGEFSSLNLIDTD